MRKLILQVQTSVDGFIADANGSTSWMRWSWGPVWTWDAQLQKDFIHLHEDIDTILLSRKMAEEGFIHHWGEVAAAQENLQSAFAKEINAAEKIVFSNTLPASTPAQKGWKNAIMANASLNEAMAEIKKEKDKRNIIVYGGAAFVSALIAARHVDEFYLYVNPTLLGAGLTIFGELPQPLDLTLVDATAYPCGINVLHYSRG